MPAASSRLATSVVSCSNTRYVSFFSIFPPFDPGTRKHAACLSGVFRALEASRSSNRSYDIVVAVTIRKLQGFGRSTASCIPSSGTSTVNRPNERLEIKMVPPGPSHWSILLDRSNWCRYILVMVVYEEFTSVVIDSSRINFS